MTEQLSPSARWDAMTDQERNEFLATEVMGWNCPKRQATIEERGTGIIGDVAHRMKCRGCFEAKHGWNPLTDWNHWRQVEEKVMAGRIRLRLFL